MSEVNRQRFDYLGCFDQVEVRALVGELEQAGPEHLAQGRDMVMLGHAMLAGCGRQPGETGECPLPGAMTTLRNYVIAQEDTRYDLAAQRAAALRRYPLAPEHEPLAATIDRAAAKATFLFARASGLSHGSIQHRTRFPSGSMADGSCVQMSYIMQRLLAEENVATRIKYAARPPGFFHYFLKTEGIADGPFTIDPTWQQFLPSKTAFATMPATLIMPESQLPQAIAAHEVPERSQDIWTGELYDGRNRGLPRSPYLDVVFDEQGWS